MEKIQLLGLGIIGIGAIICAGYGLYHFFKASNIPMVIRLGVTAIIIGVIILLVSLTRERIREEVL